MRSHARGQGRLTLTTFGGAALSRGRPDLEAGVLFGPGKPLALLVYLRCSPDRTASRDHLIDLLWSESHPEAGGHSLRETLSHISRRVGFPVASSHHGRVTLTVDIACDRTAFVDAVDRADRARAVDLYRGHFLPSLKAPGAAGFEQWADLERYRLRRLFTRAAESLAREWLVAARFRDAQQLARRMRDADLEDEAGWRLLLEALLVAGDHGSAAAEADVLEWQLAVGGREPEPATRAVLRRVRQGSAARGAVAQPPMVGREAQLAALLGAWERARSGAGVHLHVTAPGGFGKTRLLKEAHASLSGLGARAIYLAASASARDTTHAFAAELVAALAALPGSAGVPPGVGAALVRLNPALAGRFAAGAEPTVGEAAVWRTLALAELVRAVSDEQPIALLLDDWHWVDSASRPLLQGVLALARSVRALFVTAARPLRTADVPPAASMLRLPALEVRNVRELLDARAKLPRARWAEELPGQLHATTAGSPLVLLDVLQGALDRGALAFDRDGWRCRDPERLGAELEVLRASRVQPIESHPRSVLVLPFAAADAGEIQPFSDGLTEDLIAALSRVESLRVLSWPSARKLKGTDRDAVALANELNARYVLHGSVQADAAELHVSAQLTEAINGISVWGTAWRGTREQFPGVAPEFARAIAAALLVTLSPTEERRLRRRAIPHAGAYECYLRAKEAMSRDTGDGHARAASLLRSALKLAGDNALLYATLGTAYSRHGIMTLENERTRRRCEVCARKALTLDPESADAHFLSGLVQCRRGNLKEGVRDMLRALAISPTHTDALYWCSGWLATLGRSAMARPLAQRLLEIDPLTSTNVCIPGWVEWLAGRFDAAVPWYQRWVALEPGSPVALHVTAMAFIWSQRFDDARETLQRLTTTAPSSPLAQFNPFILCALTGDKTNALAALTPQLVAAAQSYEITSWQMGAFHAMVGANDTAVDWLERAARGGFINYPMLAEYDPFLRRLHGEPRFARLLDEVKREWESLEF